MRDFTKTPPTVELPAGYRPVLPYLPDHSLNIAPSPEAEFAVSRYLVGKGMKYVSDLEKFMASLETGPVR